MRTGRLDPRRESREACSDGESQARPQYPGPRVQSRLEGQHRSQTRQCQHDREGTSSVGFEGTDADGSGCAGPEISSWELIGTWVPEEG